LANARTRSRTSSLRSRVILRETAVVHLGLTNVGCWPNWSAAGLLSRALVEIGVFLFIKMLFFHGLTTISASFDKAQSDDGLFLYFLEKFGHGSSKRAP
jgi:hypothetical protein